MKILITTDWYEPAVNGVVTSVCTLKRELEARGHEVRVLTLSQGHRSSESGGVIRLGSIGAGRIYPNARIRIALAGRFVRELVDWHPDVVHSQCEFSTFFMARKIARICGCPLIHTYHTVYEDYTNYFSPSVKVGKKAAALFSRRILERTGAVIVPTEKVRAMLRGYGVDRPIFCIPTGLDPRKFEKKLPEEEAAGLRARYGIGPDDRVLVYLGRLAREKNIDELIRYFADARTEKPDLRLLIVGDGPYRGELEAGCREHGLGEAVRFTGMVRPEDVSAYYRLGDVFVSASRSETQGLTYIEAMACGLPLLCRADACLERVIDERVNGLTFESGGDFLEDLRFLFSDRERLLKMGEAAEAKFRREFSSAAFADKVLNVYRAFPMRNAARADAGAAGDLPFGASGKSRREEHRGAAL